MKINKVWCFAVAALSIPATPASAKSISVTAGGSGVFVYRQVAIPNVPLPDNPDCEVNVGSCMGGTCTVNVRSCGEGGSCTVNAGDCRSGDNATICFNIPCDGSSPGTDGESFAGYTCSFEGGNEASGVLFNDPTAEFGRIMAGPWTVTVTDPSTNVVSDVTIVCMMQSSVTYGSGGVGRDSTVSGNTGVLIDTITFNRVPGAVSYLCTLVEWNSSKGHTAVIYDADNDTSNGYQCAEITYTN